MLEFDQLIIANVERLDEALEGNDEEGIEAYFAELHNGDEDLIDGIKEKMAAYCAQEGYISVLDLLCDDGLDIEMRYEGMTLWEIAAEGEEPLEVTNFLNDERNELNANLTPEDERGVYSSDDEQGIYERPQRIMPQVVQPVVPLVVIEHDSGVDADDERSDDSSFVSRIRSDRYGTQSNVVI